MNASSRKHIDEILPCSEGGGSETRRRGGRVQRGGGRWRKERSGRPGRVARHGGGGGLTHWRSGTNVDSMRSRACSATFYLPSIREKLSRT